MGVRWKAMAVCFVLVAAPLWGAVAGQGWGTEPPYERVEFRRASQLPADLVIEGNGDLNVRRWAGFTFSRPSVNRLRRIAIGGSSALLQDGRALRFYPGWGSPTGVIDEVRLYRAADVSPYFDHLLEAEQGIFPPLPSRVPDFPGYEHRQSTSVFDHGYIGLWRRTDRRAGTLVAAYLDREGAVPVVLGRTGANYETITASIPCGAYAFTVTSEPHARQPLYMIYYDWTPTPERSGGLLRPRAANAPPC